MIKLIPIENKTPYYHVIFNYMIGDADGSTTYDFTCNESEIEKVVKYVSILNKLKPLKDHWGICFDDYCGIGYPGEYIGLSEVEYNVFMDLLDCEFYISKERSEIQSCLASRNEYSFLVFQGIEIYYYDENNTKYKVEWN
jgi:hypothetical protein